MSKAFVKETDDEVDLPGKPQAIPSGVKNYMTPEGHRRMQDELRQLLRVERPKVVETWPGRLETATARRTATTSTVSAACARLTVTIVGVDEADLNCGQVSWLSPIARALMKAHQGDIVELRAPAAIEQIEVLAIPCGVANARPAD